jgi:hypothetical protein
MIVNREWRGSMPEWLMGADCKSAARATLVQIQLGPFMKNNASWSFFKAHSNPIRLCSSVVEHFIGNEEVTGSIPVKGLGLFKLGYEYQNTRAVRRAASLLRI